MDFAERILRITAILDELKEHACYVNPIEGGIGLEPSMRLLQEAFELVNELTDTHAFNGK